MSHSELVRYLMAQQAVITMSWQHRADLDCSLDEYAQLWIIANAQSYHDWYFRNNHN